MISFVKIIEPKQLEPLRHALLELHQELLRMAKDRYEQSFGKIKTTGEYFQLVTGHPAFQPFRWLSALIASMDELMEDPAKAETGQIGSLIKFVESQLLADKTDTEFAGFYFQALQKEPGVGVAHGRVIAELKNLNS